MGIIYSYGNLFIVIIDQNRNTFEDKFIVSKDVVGEGVIPLLKAQNRSDS